MFVENGPAQTYKYVGSPVTSPTTIPTSPFPNHHSPTSNGMAEREVASPRTSNLSPAKKARGNRHVTFSEPEISHVLITHEEPVFSDVLHSPVATVEKPLTIRRYYLAEPGIVDQLRRLKSSYCLDTLENWAEMYYDTPASSLCSLECILMKDTRSSKYWKFFSFAEDNIMEITTDEKEINEPLSRLVPAEHQNGPKDLTNKSHHGKNADQRRRIIDSDSLKPFFSVRNETDSFVTVEDGTHLKVTVTDYGFAWVVVERLCIDGDRLADITLEMETMAKELGKTA